MTTCAGCGFVYDTTDVALARLPARLEASAGAVAEVLRCGGARSRVRSEPEVWSVLEYGCHLRDVLLVQRERLLLALRTDTPTVMPMGREERGEADGYAEQALDDVARQLQDAAALLARCVSRLDAARLDRMLVYNYPESAERPLRWLAVHALHEVDHHGDDIRRQVEHFAGTTPPPPSPITDPVR